MNENTLSKADQRLLDRLRIPQAQKLVLENHWLANPKAKTSKIYRFGLTLLGLLVTVILASPYFTSGTQPLVNVAIVILWLFYPALAVASIIIVFAMASYAVQGNDKILDRTMVAFLPGGATAVRLAYAVVIYVVQFGLTASEGHFITSFMIVFCLGAHLFTRGVCARGIKEALAKKVEAGPVVRVIPTITAR